MQDLSQTQVKLELSMPHILSEAKLSEILNLPNCILEEIRLAGKVGYYRIDEFAIIYKYEDVLKMLEHFYIKPNDPFEKRA